MSLFQTRKSCFLEAIKKSDIAFLRTFLVKHPKYLELKFTQERRYDGFALDMAVYFNQPEVIEFLVTEKKVNINQQDRTNQRWTALHLACRINAFEAAQKLIEHGADISLRTTNYDTALSMAQACRADKIAKLINASPQALEIVRADAARKQQQDKEAAMKRETEKALNKGEWSLPSPAEVIHQRKMAETGYHVTDIFNFEARYWRSITRDMNSGIPAQETFFFDNIPDTQAVHQAHTKYAELGGKIPASVINKQLLPGKSST